MILRPDIALLRRLDVPGEGLRGVFRHVHTDAIKISQSDFTSNVTLIGCFAHPDKSLINIARYARMVVQIGQSEIALRFDISLLGRLAQPNDGLGLIPGYPWPNSYIRPRSFCASGKPSSASGLRRFSAVA